ncbi:MAG: hypothetical protein J5493_02925 [Lachnospiraceae bacterium]|nr:hypothetical protein [Lachnospiraceae bacterium]
MKKKMRLRGICAALSLVLIIIMFIAPTAHAWGYHAFSVGTDYGSGNIDTSSDATTASTYYSRIMPSSYSIIPTVSIMTGSFSDGLPRIKSDILFLSGHGNFNNVVFNYHQQGGTYKTGVYYTNSCTADGYTLIGLNGNMLNTQLIVFAACKTASGTDNLASNAHNYGAIASVGWTASVVSTTHSTWLNRFNDYVTSSHSVQAAVNYANSFTYLPLSGVKTAKIYGTNGWIPHISDEGLSSPIIPETDENYRNFDIMKISDDLMVRLGLDPFSTDIRVYESYPGYYTIDFVRMVGVVETDSIYTVFIENYDLSEIIDHSYLIDPETEQKILKAVNAHTNHQHLDNMQSALETVDACDDKKGIAQEFCYYYNRENGMVYEVVATDYYYDGTTALGRELQLFIIE